MYKLIAVIAATGALALTASTAPASAANCAGKRPHNARIALQNSAGVIWTKSRPAVRSLDFYGCSRKYGKRYFVDSQSGGEDSFASVKITRLTEEFAQTKEHVEVNCEVTDQKLRVNLRTGKRNVFDKRESTCQ